MAVSVQEMLAAKGITPGPGHLEKLEAKWVEIQQLKEGLNTIDIDDADIALRNIPGGDHVG